MSLIIELSKHADRTEHNLRVWEKLLVDPEVAKVEESAHCLEFHERFEA